MGIRPSPHGWPVGLSEAAEGLAERSLRFTPQCVPSCFANSALPTHTLFGQCWSLCPAFTFQLFLTWASCLPSPRSFQLANCWGGGVMFTQCPGGWTNSSRRRTLSRVLGREGQPWSALLCAWPEPSQACLPGCPRPGPAGCQCVSASASSCTNYGCDVSSSIPGPGHTHYRLPPCPGGSCDP